MPKYISEVIDQINYNANFNFDFDQLKNDVSQANHAACGKYKSMIDAHLYKLQKLWYKELGAIESGPAIKLSEYATGTYGDYYPGTGRKFVHNANQSLKNVCKSEFGTSKQNLSIIDQLISMHDRSRFSEDEFYASANHFYGTDDAVAFKIAEQKHFQRNAHELPHYMFLREDGPSKSVWVIDDCETGEGHTEYIRSGVSTPMPAVFAWARVAVWLANWKDTVYKYNYANLKSGYTPFQYFWGRDSNYVITSHFHENAFGTWYTYTKDLVPWTTECALEKYISIHPDTKAAIARIVDRWSLYIDKPADEDPP